MIEATETAGIMSPRKLVIRFRLTLREYTTKDAILGWKW